MDKRFKHPFHNIAPAYREMRRKLPKEVSDIAVDEFKGNFRVGGYRGDVGTTFWKERSTNSWGKRNSKVQRALLIKSGRLRRGIRPQPTYDAAKVINDVPYAETHNKGFKGNISQRVRSFSRRGKKGGKVAVKSFVRKIKMNIPARPFMISGKPLLNNIDKHITSQLTKLWQNLKP